MSRPNAKDGMLVLYANHSWSDRALTEVHVREFWVGRGFCVGVEGKRRAPTRRCGALAVRKRCVPLRFGAVCAGVLLEALLSDPVKCKRGKGALKARGDKTPTAVRAAPACESFIFSPNHASRHECTS